jgi:4-hydroxy-2-oxoheptanedioate aldolase
VKKTSSPGWREGATCGKTRGIPTWRDGSAVPLSLMLTPPLLPEKFPLFGLCVCYPSPGIIERIGPDWDWIWIDGQHGEIGPSEILALVRACDLIRRPALVRVPGHDYGAIGCALDTGAAGVIVPCVDTEEQARALVFAAKFPPLGGRSYGSRRSIDLYGRLYAEKANAESLLVVQIETPLAIANVEAIAAVPGVDALFLGPDDIMLRRGFAMNTPRTAATLGDDFRAVAAACKRQGKKAVAIGATAEMATLAVKLGFHLVVGGTDVGFLATGSTTAAAELRRNHSPC